MTFTHDFLEAVVSVADQLDHGEIDRIADILADTRNRYGRLFILGVGGSAANASHAVNDFRKICGIEAYAPTDNIAEITARTNDQGWETVFDSWLKGSNLKPIDTIMILSVGGGDIKKNISPNLVKALIYSQNVGSRIVGIVSRNGGYTKKVADACVMIPVTDKKLITPIAESFQSVIWHLLANHPKLVRK